MFISFALLVVFGGGLLAVNVGFKRGPKLRRATSRPGRAEPAARRRPTTVAVAPSRRSAARAESPTSPAPPRQSHRAHLDPDPDRRPARRAGTPAARRHARVDSGEAVPPHGGKCRRDRDRAEWPADAAPGPIGRGDPAARAASKRRPRDREPLQVSRRPGPRRASSGRAIAWTMGSMPCSAVGRPVDDALLDELEETLIAPISVRATASEFVKRVRDEIKRGRTVSSVDVRALLRRFLEETLADAAAPLNLESPSQRDLHARCQRRRKDDERREAGGRAQGEGQAASCWRPRTRSAQPPSSSSRSGAGARAWR